MTVYREGSYNPICAMLVSGLAQVSGSSSVVECDLAKVDVAGSTPVSRSKILVRVMSDKWPVISGRAR